MTLWSKSKDEHIIPLPDGSSRILVTQLCTGSSPLFIINTYMPTQGSASAYDNLLDEVHEIIQKYRMEGDILWLGDMNASYHRLKPSANDKMFRTFCKENHLSPLDPLDKQPTYHHFTGGITSRIDHILALADPSDIISSTYIEHRHPMNTSSHDPVIVDVFIRAPESVKSTGTDTLSARQKPIWKKTDIPRYKELTDQRLEALLNHDGLELPPEALVDRIYEVLLMSAAESGPPPKCHKKRNNKYPWAEDMKPIVKEIKQLFYMWKQNGRKPDDPLAPLILEKKRSLRSTQRQLAAEHRKMLLRDISQATSDDKQLFYRLVQRQRSGNKGLCGTVDFGPECTSQLEGWASYFEKLATAENLPHFSEEHHNAMKLKLHLISLKAASPVHEEQVRKHICALKLGKAADVFGLTAEHIKYASPHLQTIITSLLNKILKQEFLPDQFKVGVIAPVHKKGKPVKSPDSYRRITVASNLGKILEKEMLTRTKTITRAKQDPLQFGFTEKCSPLLCAFLITEAIAEAQDNCQPLYVTFMDSSKAFDMVDHTALLNSLYDLNIDPQLWCLYSDMYTNVMTRVRSNGQMSRLIQESRGIRQGGGNLFRSL
jgi:hypothetical protein